MKKILILLSIIALSTTVLSAGVSLPFGTQEKLETVYTLDNKEIWNSNGGRSTLDLGRYYKVFHILWFFPVWVTEEPRLVFRDKHSTDTYFECDESLDDILRENNLDKEELLSLSFYTRYGGKLLLLGLIIVFFLSLKRKKMVG